MYDQVHAWGKFFGHQVFFESFGQNIAIRMNKVWKLEQNRVGVFLSNFYVGHNFGDLCFNMQISGADQHAECQYDYLEIHSGLTKDSPLEGKFCGTKLGFKIPRPWKSRYF